MLLFGVTLPATVPQGSEIPEGLMNNPVYFHIIPQRARFSKKKIIYHKFFVLNYSAAFD
jgi:hypothetical protein